MEILREELVIPQIVQQKADAAYAMVRERQEGAGNPLTGENEHFVGNTDRDLHNSNGIKKVLPLVAVAVMLLAGFAVAAGTRWSVGMSEKWQVEESQKESLQEEGAVSFAMQSQTQNGVTITAEQSITDNYSVYLAFRVEGYTLQEGMSPGFEGMEVTVDGVDGANYSAGFYDGLVTGEEGSMSYFISMTESEKGWALGRDIHVAFKNLCGYEDKTGELDPESVVNGNWNFGWNLQGTDRLKEWQLEVPVGDSGAVIHRIELSPASGYVEYHWPRQKETRQAVGPDGELIEISRWVRAPRMSGVKLEDGTEYRYLFSGDGGEGYLSTDQETTQYYACRGNERIIDPDQVVSLFFENTVEGGFYEVELESR